MTILNAKTVKISAKGQIVIPASIRKDMGINPGDELVFVPNQDGNYMLEKMPKVSELDELISHIPVEHIELDKSGHVDPTKSPDFYDWMVNG